VTIHQKVKLLFMAPFIMPTVQSFDILFSEPSVTSHVIFLHKKCAFRNANSTAHVLCHLKIHRKTAAYVCYDSLICKVQACVLSITVAHAQPTLSLY
jgi:hypothetical protein